MADTPKTVKVDIDWDAPAAKEALSTAEKVGFERGLDQGRNEVIDWLEHAYLDDPGRPDRGIPKAEAIMELARAAGKHIQKLRRND